MIQRYKGKEYDILACDLNKRGAQALVRDLRKEHKGIEIIKSKGKKFMIGQRI